jgi:hypothetical protein
MEGTMKTVQCPYCGRDAELVSDKEVYERSYGRRVWLCRPCNAYVGCHQGTNEALGTLANQELREARMKAHMAFDKWWKEDKVPRTATYAYLAGALGIRIKECHIGMFDLETCQQVADICEVLHP